MASTMKFTLFLSLFLLILTGCRTTTGHYMGALADVEGTKKLAINALQSQRWQDLYLQVDSLLERQGDEFYVTGHYSFAQHPQMMYTRAAHFTLTLFLLDDHDRVVGYRTASSFGMLRTSDRMSFSVSLPIVADVSAYTFGYEVTFIDEDGAAHVQWHLPRTAR
ncbi:MAG: hypothetical protein R6V33_07780 [Pelovirga sp.]